MSVLLTKLAIRLNIIWCAIFHRKYHTCYWSQFDRHFMRCNFCNCRFSRPREWIRPR